MAGFTQLYSVSIKKVKKRNVMKINKYNKCLQITINNHNYQVERDIYGYAKAISLDGIFVLHLIPGSSRNEENVENIVKVLNGTE